MLLKLHLQVPVCHSNNIFSLVFCILAEILKSNQLSIHFPLIYKFLSTFLNFSKERIGAAQMSFWNS